MTSTVIDLLPGEPSGRNVDHVALSVRGADLYRGLREQRFDIVAGPMRIWGAHGYGVGVYVRDPDGHIIELKAYDWSNVDEPPQEEQSE